MNFRPVAATTFFLFLLACRWETVEPGGMHLVRMGIPEARFQQVRPGMTPENVVRTVGKPESQESTDSWKYSIWRGDMPGFIRMFFSGPPRGVFLDARVHFQNGKVTRTEVIESSAVEMPPKK